MKESHRRLLRPFGIFFSVFASLIGIAGAFSYFGYPLLQDSGALGILSLMLLSIIVALSYVILENTERIVESTGSPNLFSKAVIKQIEHCIDKNESQSAIVLAKAMSRPLWLEGRYKERLRLGELLQQAASSLNPPDLSALTQTLIDELGWTNVELNNLEVASKNINEGIQYARQINNVYMIARGYRHMSGVAQRKGDKENAEYYLNLAEKASEDIIDKKRQKEMLAGISFGRGDLCLMTNERSKTEEAKANFFASKGIYEELGDRERLVYTNKRLGQAYQRLKQSGKAYEFYYQSLKSARELGWLQQICEIDLHLGQLMLEENKLVNAQRILEEARTIAEYANFEHLCQEAITLLNWTKTKLKH